MLRAAVAVLLLAAGAAAAAPGDGPRPTRTVLILSSERSDLPSVPDFDRGLRSRLAEPGIEFFVEYFDFGRFPGDAQADAMARYLRARYAGRTVDVVVAFQESAFEFALARRGSLFPGVPVIGAGVERQHVEGRSLPAEVTTIPVIYDYRRTLALALTLQPEAREVLIVHGVADYDRRRGGEARRAAEGFAPRLAARVLSGVPLAGVEDEVRRLPAGAFVLLVSMVRDAEGKALVGQDYAERLAAVSPVPIYGTFGSHVERGTLGGAITDFGEIGRAAAAVVAAALRGQRAASSAALELPETPLRVNGRSLMKWEIPPERVPAGAQVLFRQPGLWEAYRNFALGALAAVLLQALLIGGLIVQLRRRQRAEAELRRAESTLRLAVDALPIAVLMVNQRGAIVFANPPAEKLLGYGAGELAGRSADELVPERLRSAQGWQRAAFFSAGRRELAARRKDGSEVPIEIVLNPIQSSAQRLVLAALVDLSARHELQRKQQELEHITRVTTLGEIAASLAHELSQPLAAILANAQAGLRFLGTGPADPEEMRSLLQDVVDDDKRAGEVVHALGAMLRRGKIECVRLDAAQVVGEVLALLHSELIAQQVEVTTALEGGCTILANKTQMEQVLLNLMLNAIDAMRSRPADERWLHLEVARDGGIARISVRDAGIGIPADQLDKVFDAFWTTKPAGLGMGLAICRSILKSCGGAIEVAPNRSGPGVTFTVTLPLAAD
jgi:PAS domain S-box-containing protein